MFRHIPLLSAIFYGTSVALVQNISFAQSAEEIAKLAKSVSVKIEVNGETEQGSGVILQQKDDLYTVLTAAHVVKIGHSFTLTTAVDEQSYEVIANSVKRAVGDIDLAVVQFRSSRKYSVIKVGDSNKLEQGNDLYVVGFPVPTRTITESVFVFRKGDVTANSNKVFDRGYSLIYSNNTLPGMSGGAVLNKNGELVAIHGRGDASVNNQKTGFNLGIPISRFGTVAKGMGVQLGVEIVKVPTEFKLKADDYFLAAYTKQEAGNFQGALADYDQSITLNPNYADAYYTRGNLKHLKLNDPNGALADYDHAFAIKPPSPKAYYNRAHLKHLKLNDPQGALDDYNQAIAINPNYAIAYHNRAILKAEKLNDPKGALVDYDQTIALGYLEASVYSNRGNLKVVKLNDPKGALEDYSQAILIDPKYGEAYYNRGKLRWDRFRNRPGAVEDLQAGVKIFRLKGQKGYLDATLVQLRELGAKE